MNGAEILTTIAQLSVAVIGFSGIAIAFNRQPGRLSEVESYRVLILFANSFAAIFLSLLPFALYYFGLSETAVWRTGSALCLLFELVFLAIHIPRTLTLLHKHRDLFSVPQLCFVLCGHVANVVIQLVNAAGLLTGRTLSLFILGLLWLLFHSVFQFGRILFVQPLSGGAVSKRSRPEENEPL